MDGIMELLAERGKTHGDFADHARIAQRLKAVVWLEADKRLDRGQDILSVTQFETLDMICHKIGRIIAGNADFADHWDDIAGYAKLCSKHLVVPEAGDEYPFRDHRTMAEVMRDEAACPLDGRNCPPDHDRPVFGEGDETTAYGRAPGTRCNHRRLTLNCSICNPRKPAEHIHHWTVDPHCRSESLMVCAICGQAKPITDPLPPVNHAHRWRVADDPEMMECTVERCGALVPITDQWPGQYTVKLPEVELIDGEKYPCHCQDQFDRCRVENGKRIGNNVFCCKAEAGR